MAARADGPRAVSAPPDSSLASRGLGDFLEDHEYAESNDFLVDPLLSGIGLSALVAPPKTGKSLAVMQLLLSVAAGIPFLGFAVKRSRVLLVDEETPPELSAVRFKQMLAAEPAFGAGETLKNFRVLSFAGVRVDAKGLDLLRREMDAHGPGLVSIDCWRRVFRGKEDSSQEVSAAMESLVRLREDYCTQILLVHHTVKNSSDGNGWETAARGSGDFFASLDGMLGLSRSKAGVRLRASLRAGPELDPPVSLEFDPATLLFRRVESAPKDREAATGKLADQILALLVQHGPLSVSAIGERVTARKRDILAALNSLESRGAAAWKPGPKNSRLWEAVSRG